MPLTHPLVTDAAIRGSLIKLGDIALPTERRSIVRNQFISRRATMEYINRDDATSTTPHHRTWMPAFAGTWWAAATIVTAVRFRLRLTGRGLKLGWDDAMLLSAWIFGTLLTAALILQATYGQGNRYQ